MMNEFDKRCRRLRQKMQEASVDAYLVTSPDNIYYLSGFTGCGSSTSNRTRALFDH